MPDAQPAPSPAATPPTPQPVGNAPAAAGMMTPQSPTGEIEAAKLDVYHAVKLLDRAVARLGTKSDEGAAALKARAALTRTFGEHEDTSEEFSPSEIKRMLASLAGPGATGGPPPQGAPPQKPGA
jgi:hypothetical protein